MQSVKARQSTRSTRTVRFSSFRRSFATPDQSYLQFKRVLDFSIALSALLVSLPILAVVCCAVALESPGAPIFTQRRIGAGGKPFKLYKIRTMFANTEKASCVTRKADPRITDLGRWLRCSKIDELPQLINILLGDMSIIGPRPLSQDECNFIVDNKKISEEHPGFIPVGKPGLIGLEQLSRERGLDYKQRFALNAKYEQQLGWSLDLGILFHSIIQCRVVVYCVALACLGEFASIAICGKGILFHASHFIFGR